MSEKKKKSFGMKFLIFVLEVVAAFVVSFVVSTLIKHRRLEFSADVLTDTYFLPIFGVLVLGLVLLMLTKALKKSPDDSSVGIKYKDDKKKYYDTDWLTIKQLETDRKYMYHEFRDLGNTNDIGIPIRAQYKDGKLHVNMYDSIHTLVIGSTGSGKTSQIINPFVQILASTKHKPSLVVSDPKGEIHRDNYIHLKNNGYKVMVFDLINPFVSTCWNPLDRPYQKYYRAKNLDKEVITHEGESPANFKLKMAGNEFYNTWYEFEGVAFPNKEMLDRKMLSVRQTLETEAMEDLKELSGIICPIEDKNQPIWEKGAQNLINAVLIAMLEDCMDPELDMDLSKFNLFNMAKICNFRDNDPYNVYKTITTYFQGRDKFSAAPELANEVLANADDTKRSYFGVVANKMNLYSDMGICYCTSKNEMNLQHFADEPTALFIKVPDHKVDRHPLACMFISQLYKVLVDIANEPKNNGSLPRQVHYLLDEFANIPKIPNIETIITVARSRKVFFTLILQNYAQLNSKYDKDIADTIKDNCNIQIYIASNDPETRKQFSDLCGKTTVQTITTSASKSKGKDGKGDDKSSSTGVSEEQRPLIYPEELDSLPEGVNIVHILKNPPIKAEFTRYFKVPLYTTARYEEPYHEPGIFEADKLYYDITKRNAIKTQKTAPRDTDNSFFF